MKNHKYKLLILAAVLTNTTAAWSQPSWYVKSYLGFSQISDLEGTSTNIGDSDGPIDVNLDSGFFAGGAVGYRFNDRWSTDLSWEYRSNDSETTIADGTAFNEGNYASNVFSLNGYYHFEKRGKWQPYIGAGLMYGQEIDIDLEMNGEELSYTEGGDIGFQVMWGTYYALTDQWLINGEVKYGRFSDIDLTGESTSGTIKGLDYDPLSFSVGLEYRF